MICNGQIISQHIRGDFYEKKAEKGKTMDRYGVMHFYVFGRRVWRELL